MVDAFQQLKTLPVVLRDRKTGISNQKISVLSKKNWRNEVPIGIDRSGLPATIIDAIATVAVVGRALDYLACEDAYTRTVPLFSKEPPLSIKSWIQRIDLALDDLSLARGRFSAESGVPGGRY